MVFKWLFKNWKKNHLDVVNCFIARFDSVNSSFHKVFRFIFEKHDKENKTGLQHFQLD